MADSPYPSLRWSRVLGILLLLFAIARLTPWVSLGITGLSANGTIGNILRPQTLLSIINFYCLGLGLLGIWAYSPSTGKSLGLPHLLYGAIVVLICSVVVLLAEAMIHSRPDRLGWLGVSTFERLLLTGSVSVLWGYALALRSDNLRRIAAQSLLVSLGFGLLIAMASFALQIHNSPQTLAAYFTFMWTHNEFLLLSTLGSLPHGLSTLLLCWVGIDSLRRSFTPDQQERRSKRDCRLILIWVVCCFLYDGLPLVAALLRPALGTDGTAAHEFWRSGAEFSAMAATALALADYLRMKSAGAVTLPPSPPLEK